MTARAQAKTIEGAGSKPVAKSPAAAATVPRASGSTASPIAPRARRIASSGAAEMASSRKRAISRLGASMPSASPSSGSGGDSEQRGVGDPARNPQAREGAGDRGGGTEDRCDRKPSQHGHEQNQRHQSGHELELP